MLASGLLDFAELSLHGGTFDKFRGDKLISLLCGSVVELMLGLLLDK